MSGVDLARDRFPHDVKEAKYFLSKTYNTITVESKLIKAKYIYYGLCCLQLIIYESSHTALLSPVFN